MMIRDFGPVHALPGADARERLCAGSYAHIDSDVPGVIRAQELKGFVPRLVCFESPMAGERVREAFRNESDGYRPASWAGHAAFALAYPAVQNEDEPHPIVSAGEPLMIGSFPRIIATYWNRIHGRSLYTFFDCAQHGPLVWHLVVRPLDA